MNLRKEDHSCEFYILTLVATCRLVCLICHERECGFSDRPFKTEIKLKHQTFPVESPSSLCEECREEMRTAATQCLGQNVGEHGDSFP